MTHSKCTNIMSASRRVVVHLSLFLGMVNAWWWVWNKGKYSLNHLIIISPSVKQLFYMLTWFKRKSWIISLLHLNDIGITSNCMLFQGVLQSMSRYSVEALIETLIQEKFTCVWSLTILYKNTPLKWPVFNFWPKTKTHASCYSSVLVWVRKKRIGCIEITHINN